MNEMDRMDKELTDQWREEAGKLPESTRRQIIDMKKSGKSGRQICSALGLCSEHVSIIIIEEFAKERGETPVFSVGRSAHPDDPFREWIES